MKINESYDGKTWLKDWWVIVKSNFTVIKENIETITSDITGIKEYIGNMGLVKEDTLADAISVLDENYELLSQNITEQENNLDNNYYTKAEIDAYIGDINTALENTLNGGAS